VRGFYYYFSFIAVLVTGFRHCSDIVRKTMVLRHMIYPHVLRPSFLSAIFVLRSTCASTRGGGGGGRSSSLLIPCFVHVDKTDTAYTVNYSNFEVTD